MKKNIFIWLGIAIVLIIAAYLVLQKSGEQVTNPKERELYLKLDSTAVDKIELKNKHGAWAVEKRSGGWFLIKPVIAPADSEFIAGVIHLLANMQVKSVVSSNPAKRSLFQVDTSASVVKIYQNKELLTELYIGKPGSVYDETYIREANSDDVVVVTGTLFFAFDAPIINWRDAVILNLNKNDISQIDFDYGKEKFSLVQKDSALFLDNKKLDFHLSESVLAAMTYVTADSFVDTALAVEPLIKATISFAGNQLLVSEPFADDKHYIRKSDSKTWYIIGKTKAESLLRKKSDLLMK